MYCCFHYCRRNTQTSGDKNVFVGSNAGNRQGGSNNVMIGYGAGSGSGSGSGNVFLGSNAGKLESGSNKLELNTTDAQTVVSGDFDIDAIIFHENTTINGHLNLNGNWISSDGDDEGIFIKNNGNVGIGTNAPSSKLSVNGNMLISARNHDFKFETDKYIMMTEVDAKFASIRVNGGNGDKSTYYTTSDWVTTSKTSPGVYDITFTSGTFTKTPIITGMATQDSNRLVIVSASKDSAVVETRDLNGNLIYSHFMLNIIGE